QAAPAMAPLGEVFVPTSSSPLPDETAHVNWYVVGGVIGGGVLLLVVCVTAVCYCTRDPRPVSLRGDDAGGELVVLDQAGQPQRVTWRVFS
ncbi:hypothetical protein MKW92_019003, partial [Papaver armeniacum]